jgi:Holliday junction DNA helicase RuvB
MTDQKPADMNDVAPTILKHLVGQRGVVDQVAVALEAANADGKKMDHALLVGPPGMGKTALARVVASEMGTQLHEVLGQSLAAPSDLNALLLGAKDKDIIHVDEAHELDREYQTALYLALDQRKVLLQGRTKSGPQSIPLADFTLLLSTTDEYGLLQPLRDRMKLTLRFEFYKPEDLASVVRLRSRALGWDVDDDVLPLIARRARGTPRLALRLLQSCRRVCRAEAETAITHRHLLRACDLEGIDEIGLGPTEQQYLTSLAEGTTRLNVVASLLGLPARTVSQVVEPFLLRLGFVVKDDQGRRELTVKGREHLSQSAILRDPKGEHS